MFDFVAMLQDKGCPFDGMVGMVDGHFQSCCRPGGMGCINDNLFDYQMFNGTLQPARPRARSWLAVLAVTARVLPPRHDTQGRNDSTALNSRVWCCRTACACSVALSWGQSMMPPSCYCPGWSPSCRL